MWLARVRVAIIPNIPIAVIALLFTGFLSPIWLSPVNLYASFTDDFYYYLKIAVSFNEGLGLCFTPNIHTNGFQPFFQFFIVGLVWVARELGASPLVLIRVVLGVLFLLCAWALLRKIKPKGGVATLLFSLGMLSYYFISYSGMESIFIVPLLAWFVLSLQEGSLSPYKAAVIVMLAFFLRIDSFVITLPLLAYYYWDKGLLRNPFREGRWKTLLICAGIMAVPVCLYLLANYRAFGTFFPISGLAKTVVKVAGVNWATFQSFFRYYPYSTYNVAMVLLLILIALTGNFKEKIYFHLFALATLLFYLQTAVRSDWGLWAWYFYPIPVLAFMMASRGRALFAGPGGRFPLYNRLIYALSAASSVMMIMLAFVVWLFYTFPLYHTSPMGQGKVDILHIAGIRMREFEKRHPAGVYAMGDRAGIVGYLLKSPLVQMEGLVMDKQYMKRMLGARRLKDLLQPYKVDYYVATNPDRLDDSTFIIKEPVQSHGLSHQIIDTIHWNVCDSFTLESKGVFTGQVNDWSHTYIFRVPGSGERAAMR